jgi:hypothetical protein
VICQIAVQEEYRKAVVSLAHDSSMTEHLGVNETSNGILAHFNWPRALIIVLTLIFLSGMAIEKRVEVHIIVSKYIFSYLVLGSSLTQSTMTLLKDYSKAGTG